MYAVTISVSPVAKPAPIEVFFVKFFNAPLTSNVADPPNESTLAFDAVICPLTASPAEG